MGLVMIILYHIVSYCIILYYIGISERNNSINIYHYTQIDIIKVIKNRQNELFGKEKEEDVLIIEQGGGVDTCKMEALFTRCTNKYISKFRY